MSIIDRIEKLEARLAAIEVQSKEIEQEKKSIADLLETLIDCRKEIEDYKQLVSEALDQLATKAAAADGTGGATLPDVIEFSETIDITLPDALIDAAKEEEGSP